MLFHAEMAACSLGATVEDVGFDKQTTEEARRALVAVGRASTPRGPPLR